MLDSLSLVWGRSVHFAKFPILQFLKLCSNPNFHPIHPNFLQGIIIIQAVPFLAICQKLQKLWHFEFFLNTGPYATGIFKVLFLPQFSLSPSHDGKSKWLLEYCNEKLASSTWDNIFILFKKLFKTFLCTGSSVQAQRQGPWASCFYWYISIVQDSHACGWHKAYQAHGQYWGDPYRKHTKYTYWWRDL